MNKIKLLFILPDLEPGGAQRVLITIFNNMDRTHFDPYMLIINSKGPMKRFISKSGVYGLGRRRLRYSIIHIIRWCRKIEPDLIISTMSHLNLALITFKRFLPEGAVLIIREANTPEMRLRHSKYPVMYFTLYRMLYHFSDHIICNSNHMKENMVKLFPKTKDMITVIPNPVDMDFVRMMSAGYSAVYPDGKYRLVSVGRLDYQKGFDRLLKVFKIALEKRPDLSLTVVGGGPEHDKLMELANMLGISSKVKFTGYLENPYPYMARAHLFISTSRWEGLPNVVLESLACGTPVVAFDCPGGTAEIVKNGFNGWLVRDGDIFSMAKKICDVLSGGEHKRILKNELFPSEYEMENVLKLYESFFAKKAIILPKKN
jgi:glycosyltransferase involved in cell wall biosynthesis